MPFASGAGFVVGRSRLIETKGWFVSSDWESVVSIAREVDQAYAKGEEPEPGAVTRLARAVLNFERRLAEPQVKRGAPPASGSTGNSGEPPV